MNRRHEGMTSDNTWSCLFTDANFDNLVEQTQLYAIRDKGNHNFYQMIPKGYQFIGIRVLYRFIGILVHVADNKNLVEGSKIAKMKPLYDAFNMILKQFGIWHDKLSIKKRMVPYKGLYSICQYMKSRPSGDLVWSIKFGYKIWSLCGNDGYPYHIDIHCEMSEGPRNEFSLGGKVVLEMVITLKDMNDDDMTNCDFFFDNYFTSYKLIESS